MPAECGNLRIEFLGMASVRIASDETTVYVDPWSEVVDGRPRDGDLVFATHGDFDHYDPDAIEAVLAPDGAVAVCEAIDASDLDVGADVVDLAADERTAIGGVGVETTPAYNDPDGPHVDDAGDPFHAEGEGIGLSLTVDGVTVLYPSDTDVLELHRSLDADVLLPPIGGRFTMDRRGAADLARAIDPDLVVPIHYDAFEPIEADARAFADELDAEGIRVQLL